MNNLFKKSDHKKSDPRAYTATGKPTDIPITQDDPESPVESDPAVSSAPESNLQNELHQTQITEFETKIAKLESELKEAQSETLRAIAETQTIQRRKHVEIGELRKYGPEPLAKQLVSPLLDLERIVQFSVNTEAEKLLEAVQMLYSKLGRALEAVAIEKIAPKPGTPFDPALHEAIGSMPSTEFADHSVAILIEPGWKMHDHLLHAAKVMVAVKPEAGE